jgi:hypothetical protein
MSQPVKAMVQALTELTPHLTFEDMPLSLALYPWVEVQDGFCVINWPGQPRHGKRWGMSATWDRTEDHYMLPAAVLAKHKPNSAYVTAHQVFDFIYTPNGLIDACEANSHYRQSTHNDLLAVEYKALDPDEAMHVYTDAGTEEPHPTYTVRLFEMLKTLDAAWLAPYVFTMQLRLGATLIGWMVNWLEGDTCTQVFRYVKRQHKGHTRFFDAVMAQYCVRIDIPFINLGDAHRLPGLAAYKFSLGPHLLQPYFNVLSRCEEMDCNDGAL